MLDATVNEVSEDSVLVPLLLLTNMITSREVSERLQTWQLLLKKFLAV